jgi:magnesium transporter
VEYLGEKPDREVEISLLDYDAAELERRTVESVEELAPCLEAETVSWVNVDGIHDEELLQGIGDLFGLHPLVLEDLASTGQRPKVEDYGEYVFLVLRMLTYGETADGQGEVVDEQVSLVLGPNYVLSFQERPGDVFDPLRHRLDNPMARGRSLGPDYLFYRLMDAVVDHYFVVLERMGDRLDALDAELVGNPDQETLHRINRAKQELLFLRKSVWPLREVISALLREESELVDDHTRTFLRDVYDHIIQAVDTSETFRDITAGMLDIYLSSLSNRMNEVMKVLTVIATIFIPLTFVAGIYGMNFEHMPELSVPWAYPAVWGLMLAIAGGMLVYFKRQGWF